MTWTQQFHGHLKAGNLKRLNLDVFFKLSTPTAQRLYRFLDKPLLLDAGIVAGPDRAGVRARRADGGEARRRHPQAAAGALAELEKIGFLQPAAQAERYQKVKAGQWRVCYPGRRWVPLSQGRGGGGVR